MTDYPKPPFETKVLWFIEDTFDVENAPGSNYLDLNALSDEELLTLAEKYPVAEQIISFRQSHRENQFDFNSLLEYIVFVDPTNRKVQAIFLVGGFGPLRRSNKDWIAVDRESDPDIAKFVSQSLMYKTDYARLLRELPEMQDDEEDDDSMVVTTLDAAFDDESITEDLVRKYSVLLTSPDGVNPEIDYL